MKIWYTEWKYPHGKNVYSINDYLFWLTEKNIHMVEK